jgi:hypothetical protein
MKKIGFIIFVLALLVGVVFANFTSFGKADIGAFNFTFKRGERGSGNVVTENRGLSGFKAVEVGGVFNVEIVAQKEFSVEVEADDNLLPLIKTEVHNGVLEISTEKRIRSKTRMTIRIGAPDIERLEISGVAKVSLADVSNEKLTVDTSGASKVMLAGQTRDLTIDVSGASKVDAASVSSVNAFVDASGASKVLVNVSGDLKADLSGASTVTYSGTPTNIDKKTSGASKVVAAN